jgi:hypothetical protein
MLVEISVVNTHYPFIILFPYKDRISDPLWMNHFFNEASREEFSYFPFNCLSLEQIFEGVAFLAQPLGVHSDSARSAPWAPLAYPLVSM